MEGQVPPATTADANDDPPFSPRLPLPPPPSGTYIVQIPRDQVYRVPPPENSRIVESYRNPNLKKERCGGKCRLYILVLLAVLVAVIGVILVIGHVFFNPTTPEFSVTKALVKIPPASNKKAKPSFDISLEAFNPNDRIGISYEDGGDTTLSIKQQKFAGGKYPSLSQDSNDIDTVQLTLAGLNAALPKEVEKSMNETTPLSLSLTMNVPIKTKALIALSKHMTVICDFKVSSLGSGTRIISQECDVKF